MDLAHGYLRLVGDYCHWLGGLRWSSTEDAIEYGHGGTFALNEEIIEFIEGFAGIRSLLCFSHILHLMKLLRSCEPVVQPPFARLRSAYVEAGRPVRNGAVLLAVLSRDLPGLPEPVPLRDVCARLQSPDRPIRWYVATFSDTFCSVPLPAIGPEEFEHHFLKALEPFTRDELIHWLRHGRGPMHDPAQSLMQQILPPTPRTSGELLEMLLDRPRLAGARRFVSRLVSALTLPSRRLAREQIAIGGYDDVAIRGQPDQILPSQFALDELDFYRRYAEHELLYFRREEPHAKTEQDLIVLLDQGVRTWGDVRLVLTAAVVALARYADRRRFPFHLATTGPDRTLVNPLAIEPERLGEMLETSDLSANPGLALESVLEQTARRPADVVLLTHPRSLNEPDVRAAARRTRPSVRLFATTLSGDGHCELHELKHGVPVRLREVHIDFREVEPRRRTDPTPEVRPFQPWEGDVEPIGFPFRFRSTGTFGSRHFAFDAAGQRLLAASTDGLLYLWHLNCNRAELLPRPLLNDRLLLAVQVVLGVAGGFALCGFWGDEKREFGVTHYDLATRKATSRSLGNVNNLRGIRLSWRYDPRQHLVLVSSAVAAVTHRLHLLTGVCDIVTYRDTVAPGIQPASIEPKTGELTFPGEPHWEPLTPLTDGQPVLRRCRVSEAKRCGPTLAAKIVGPQPEGNLTIRLFRGPPAVPVTVLPILAKHGFLLSADGGLLCKQEGAREFVVHDLTSGNKRQLQALEPHSCIHGIGFGPSHVILSTGKRCFHLIRWVSGTLELFRGHSLKTLLSDLGERPVPWSIEGTAPAVCEYDCRRFTSFSSREFIVVIDGFGQAAMLDRNERLICMVYVCREKIALWMPDGTCYGPSTITGRPDSPNALAKIGKALLRASLTPEKKV
jgi:hypothetical protein